LFGRVKRIKNTRYRACQFRKLQSKFVNDLLVINKFCPVFMFPIIHIIKQFEPITVNNRLKYTKKMSRLVIFIDSFFLFYGKACHFDRSEVQRSVAEKSIVRDSSTPLRSV